MKGFHVFIVVLMSLVAGFIALMVGVGYLADTSQQRSFKRDYDRGLNSYRIDCPYATYNVSGHTYYRSRDEINVYEIELKDGKYKKYLAGEYATVCTLRW